MLVVICLKFELIVEWNVKAYQCAFLALVGKIFDMEFHSFRIFPLSSSMVRNNILVHCLFLFLSGRRVRGRIRSRYRGCGLIFLFGYVNLYQQASIC